MHCWKCLK